MTLRLGDSRVILPTLPEHSVDAMVTDPPAGIAFMGKDWDNPDMFPLRDRGPRLTGSGNPCNARGFGGNVDWDKTRRGRTTFIAAMTEIFTECLRVLKPGGHAFIWALPRTSHWTATALEDAGFEIRDVVTHLFGQGFPKSLDVGKALDKAAGAERAVVGQARVGFIRNGRADENGDGFYGGTPEAAKHLPLTAPATDLARQWDGWGTALKPASEHWILCRAPLSEPTVAANVARWGTGALNIDGGRLTVTDAAYAQNCSGDRGHADNRTRDSEFKMGCGRAAAGRWPPNVALSHKLWCTDDACAEGCPVALLDGQSGERPSGKGSKNNRLSQSWAGGPFRPHNGLSIGGDTGGASRFFYVSKASAAERSRGLPNGERNTHPTVKPLALMRWLLTLVVPPGGIVLDPFAGSGTTLIAAAELGIEAIGIERDPEHYETARHRLAQGATGT